MDPGPPSPDFASFLADWPDYGETTALDRLRATDYGRLDAADHVYLDYTGAGLYGVSQVRAHAALLERSVLGNPHSGSPTSMAATTLVERARHRILQWFHASPDEYTVVFTANATAALKLVGEAYPFGPGGRLLLTADNHNSVNGIREFARRAGADVNYAPLTLPDLRLDQEALTSLLDRPASARKLLVFPAQSNFSGVQHPLGLVRSAQEKGWDVMLDAAAFVPTSRLDLQAVRPDFVVLSFYKMFGYPTGVGCLIARTEALRRLTRPWFAGGTVNFATVHAQAHVLAPREAGFEDGTVNFLDIPAVETGLAHLEAVGIDRIRTRVRCLTGWVLAELFALRHDNGRHMCRIYGPSTVLARGGTLTFNLYDAQGRLLDYRRVEELASEQRISIRTGCFCNPGTGETAEGITDDDVRAALAFDTDMTLPRFMQVIHHRGGRSAGALRASFGLVSNFADARRFRDFIAGFCNQTSLAIGAATFDVESCRIIRDGS